jgi:hypothetical protein
LLRDVVLGRDVVVELPGKPDLVLGGRQFLLEHLHVLVRVDLRVVLGKGEQPAERLRQLAFLSRRVSRPAGSHRSRAGLDDARQRVPFEFHDAFHGVDQVRDQVVAPLQLDVDLPPAVGRLVAQADQPVVGANHPEGDEHDDNERNEQEHLR